MENTYNMSVGWPELGQNCVHVWRAQLEVSDGVLEQLKAYLSPEECARAARFRFDRHRKPFIAGRGILRALLARYLEIDPQTVRFIYGQCGKPALPEKWESLKFNVSHSGTFALFAFAHTLEVGVDIELIRERKCLMDIARRFFAADEVEALLALPEEQQLNGFHRCWTRKEAYVKAKGDGLSLALDQFSVSIAEEAFPRLLRATTDSDESAHWRFFHVPTPESYAAVVAVQTPCETLSCWEWNEQQLSAQLPMAPIFIPMG